MAHDPAPPSNDQPPIPATSKLTPLKRQDSSFGTPSSLASIADAWAARQGKSLPTPPRQVACSECGDHGIAGYTLEQGNVYCMCAAGQAAREEARRRYEEQEAEEAAWRRKVIAERLAAFSTRTLPGGVLPSFESLPPSVALERVRAFAESWDGEQGLLLTGSVGTGKTTLLLALLRSITERLVARKRLVRLVTVPDFLRELRAGFEPQRQALGEGTSHMLEQYRTCGLLVFDDLGAEKFSDWTAEQLYVLVDHRYRQRLPIFASLNWSIEGLAERVDKRVLDRLRETCTRIEVVGPNWRDRAVQRKTHGTGRDH